MQEETLKCYRAYSTISAIAENAHSGGTATTLAIHSLLGNFCKGMVLVSGVTKKTFVAREPEDVIEACGSIYSNVKYVGWAIRSEQFGQVGKPCDMMTLLYSPKISIFCSRIGKRVKCTRFFCKDHLGRKSDISVGDIQGEAMNHVIIWTSLGQKIIDSAINSGDLFARECSSRELRQAQPYLWR